MKNLDISDMITRCRRFASVRLILAAFVLPLISPLPSFAQGYSFSQPLRVSTNDTDNTAYDTDPELSAPGDGNVYISWTYFDKAGPDEYDLLETASADGTNWSEPEFVNFGAEGDISSENDISGVVTSSSTNIDQFFMFSSNRSVFDGDSCFVKDTNIYRAEATGDGWNVETPVALVEQSGTDDYNPVYGASLTGAFYVWEQRGSETNGLGPDSDLVYVNVFASGVPQPMNTDAASDSSDTMLKEDGPPIVVGAGSSGFYCIWPSTDSLTSGTERIHVRSTGDAGQSWSTEEIIFEGIGTISSKPSAAVNSTGHVIVTFSSSVVLGGETGDDFDIVYMVLDPSSGNWSEPAYLNNSAETDDHLDENPAIAVAPNGDWVAAWATNNQAVTGSLDPDRDIVYSVSRDNGATWSTPAALNLDAVSDGPQAQDRDVTLISVNGSVHAAWVASGRAPVGPEGNFTDIYVSTGDATPRDFRSSFRIK